MFVLLADIAPDFIHLQPRAFQIPRFAAHQGRAALPGFNAKPHDRVAMDAHHALYRADAGTFAERRNDCDLLVSTGHGFIVIRKDA